MEYNWFRGWCIMKICYIAPLWRLRWHGHERYRTHLAFKYIVDKVAGLRTILYTNGCGLSMSFVSIHLIKLYERFKDIPCIIFYHWILKIWNLLEISIERRTFWACKLSTRLIWDQLMGSEELRNSVTGTWPTFWINLLNTLEVTNGVWLWTRHEVGSSWRRLNDRGKKCVHYTLNGIPTRTSL